MPFATDIRHMAPASLLLVACAGAPEPPTPEPQRMVLRQPEPRTAPVVPSWPDAWFAALLATKGSDDARDFLCAGFDEADLRYRSFDGVTLGESIDAVVAALPAAGQPGARLTEAVDVYWTAGREARVRRTAGAATCLPPPR